MTKGPRAQSSNVVRGSTGGPGLNRLRLITRTLPVLTLAVWAVTLWVPVLDSANNNLHLSESSRIVVTSLGRSPVEVEELELDFVTIWACLFTCVISAWLLDGLRLWSWATAIFGVVVLEFLGGMITEPPTIMWDGQDSNGEWIGGVEVATPDVGAWLWLVGGLALLAAGACGLLEEHPRSNCRSAHREALRIGRWFSTEPSRDGHIRVRRHRSTAEQAARMMPFVALAAWVVMIWVPIMDNTASDEDGVTLTSLGRQTAGLVDFDPSVVISWLIVLMCAAVGLAVDPPHWWPAVVLGLGAVLYALLVGRLTHPPIVRWRGETTDGQSIGAIIVGYPAAGVNYWAVGSAALVAAGICGLIGQRQQRPITAKRRRLVS